MRAQFVYEKYQFLNEDQNSLEDLSKLTKAIFNYFYKEFGPSKSLLDELDWDWNKIFDYIVPLSKFSPEKFPHIQKFMDSGIGLIYSNFNESGGAGGAGFFMNPTQYIPPEDEVEKKYANSYPAGLVVFGATEMGSGRFMVLAGESNLSHELQHAFDFWRSKGKSTEKRKYNAKVLLDANPYSKDDKDVERERKIYYNDSSELSGHFTETIKSIYWANEGYKRDSDYRIINPDSPQIIGFYDWEELLKAFKRTFAPWDYLSKNMKKKYLNKFYQYYHKFKKIYGEEGKEGLDKLGLEYHKKI